jgi:hypothetical protein
MTKFYNLPPPWDPGLAIPSNVLSEGLERHAYVTRMLPRGTYDNTPGGNPAGYAIPQYVLNEGTGRGTFTTKWLPRGYYGPRLPHYLNRQPVANIVLGDVAEYTPSLAVAITRPTALRSRIGRRQMQALGAFAMQMSPAITPIVGMTTTPPPPPPPPTSGFIFGLGGSKVTSKAPSGASSGAGGTASDLSTLWKRLGAKVTAKHAMMGPQPQSQSIVARLLPIALLGGAAFLAYRLFMKKKAESPSP